MAGRRLQRSMEKYLFNPPMRLLLRLGLAPRAFALLETKGRVSGQPRLTPIGLGIDGSTAWLVAEHGRACSYVKNLVAEPKVRVKVRRRWYRGEAIVVDDDDGVARRHAIDASNGVIGRLDGIFFSRSASEPCSVRIDLQG